MVDATWGTGEPPRDVLGPVRGEPAVGHHVRYVDAPAEHGDVGDQPPVAAPPHALAAHHRDRGVGVPAVHQHRGRAEQQRALEGVDRSADMGDR